MKIDTPLTAKPPQARPPARSPEPATASKTARKAFRDMLAADAKRQTNSPSADASKTVKTVAAGEASRGREAVEPDLIPGLTQDPMTTDHAFGFAELGLFGLSASVAAAEAASRPTPRPEPAPALTETPAPVRPSAARDLATTASTLSSSQNPGRGTALGSAGQRQAPRAASTSTSGPSATLGAGDIERGGSNALDLAAPEATADRDLEATLRAALAALSDPAQPPAGFSISQQDGAVRASLAAPGLPKAEAERLRDLLQAALADLGLVLADLTLNGAPLAVRSSIPHGDA
jgi:hypothetical protein